MLRPDYQNWQLQTDPDNILWLTLDKKNASANTIDGLILTELAQILTDIEQTKDLKGVVIQSGKTSGFIAGADIEQFTKLETTDAAFTLLRRGQEIFDQLAAVRVPTVALIDGFCLGGGLELALACRYRIAENSSKLGLPEVMLGIHPGWGGTIRLPKLIGAIAAMGLILSGRHLSAKAAKKMGLIDAAIAKRYLTKAAKYYVLTQPKVSSISWLKQMSNHDLARPFLAKIFRAQLKKKIQETFYPAPYKALDCWEKNGVEREQAFIAEAQSVAVLQENSTAKNLIRLFFMQTQLKTLGKKINVPVQHVHVVGAGVMGGDIATWCALRGFNVTLQDPDSNMIAKSLQRAQLLFKRKLKDPLKIRAAMDRLLPDPSGYGISHADVIIEAIFENLQAKQDLLKKLEEKAKPSAILATNTSSILLDEMNQVMKNPARLVGIHFFNPVAKMMLVEVVQGACTDPTVVDQALAFVHQLGKLPLPVKSSPGFLVNRVLMPYLMEAMALLQEGFSAEVIDAAAVDFGMPMGPIQLADTVGLDVCLSVAKNLTQHYGGEVPAKLVDMVAQKELGVKTNKGFYIYNKGKPIKKTITEKITATQLISLTDRLIYSLLNESAACLREGVVANGDLVDAGMVFGTGFAPFRGGTIHYAQSIGKTTLLATFAQLESICGPRFKADSEWNNIV
jgi:3-hydroxyacyl-CoA dehydrogenase/enoyl-CoA hydratase/3-hydroxybutyryl-CoA epimerase